MKMKLQYLCILILVLYISNASCISNTTYESMKIGISQFNKAGNDFLKLIRPPLDPNNIKIDYFKNFTISLEHLNKVANDYLCYYILFVIGVVFVVLMPIIGLLILCCQCCKKCGAKQIAMDPPNARCKIIAYGLVLAALTTAMLFGIIICLFNNQIVHETVESQDKSVNIFVNLKTNVQDIKQALLDMKVSIKNASSIKIDSQQWQGLTNKLDDSIKGFYSRLVSVPEVLHVIDQTKTLKSVLEVQKEKKYQTFIQNLNEDLSNTSNHLETLKISIKEHLLSCQTDDCKVVRDKTDRLQLHPVKKEIIDNIIKTLGTLISVDFQSGLTKIVDFKDNSPVSMKLIVDGELKYIKDRINDDAFSNAVKQIMNSSIDKVLHGVQIMESNIPSLMPDDTQQHTNYNTARTYESYRFYVYLGLCCVTLLIIVCYYLGLLFGSYGERATEEAGCCNRGVGARFMTGGLVLTFLFSSLIMIVVIANMLITGVAYGDGCRYTAFETENDIKVLDAYASIILNETNKEFSPQGLIDALIKKCPEKNLYGSLSTVFRPVIITAFEPYFVKIDANVSSLIINQFNLTSYLNSNPFEYTSTIDLNSLVSSISLFNNPGDLSQYLNELSIVTQQYPSDSSQMRELNDRILNLRTKVGLVVQFLNNSENEFIRWKMIGQFFDNNKTAIVKSKSPELISSVKESFLEIIDVVFNKMSEGTSCSKLSSDIKTLFNTFCQNSIDPLNGTWYGLGFYLLLSVPALVFACLLRGLYRRITKYYQDKDEPDYNEYIGFYARADHDSFRKANPGKGSSSKGYKLVPMAQRS